MNSFPNSQHTEQVISESPQELIKCLKNDISEYSRGVAALALGKQREVTALEPLLASLSDNSSWVRGWSVYALGRIQDPSILIYLCNMLEDSDAWVRQQAAEALMSFDDNMADTVLLDALKQKGPMGKSWSLHVIAGRGKYDLSLDVVPILEDEERSVRLSAVRTLYRLGQTNAIGPVRMFMRDPDKYMRGAAAYALGALRDKDSVPALCLALMDYTGWVRRNAAWSLLELGESLYLVASMKNDEDIGVRMFAENASQILDHQGHIGA